MSPVLAWDGKQKVYKELNKIKLLITYANAIVDITINYKKISIQSTHYILKMDSYFVILIYLLNKITICGIYLKKIEINIMI